MRIKPKTDIIRLYKTYKERNVSTLSSSLSYYLTLTLVPGAIAVKSIANTFSDDLFFGIQYLFPEKVRAFFDFDNAKGEKGVIAVSSLLSLYYLVRTVMALKHHLDLIYGKRRSRGAVYYFFFSVFASLFFLALIFISGACILLGKNITRLPIFSRKPFDVLSPIMVAVAFAFSFLLSVFRFLPDKRQNTMAVLPGTLFSLFFWIVSAVLFSFYLRNFPSNSLIYDSLTSVAALMLWLYVLSNIILTGACINLLFYDEKDFREAGR